MYVDRYTAATVFLAVFGIAVTIAMSQTDYVAVVLDRLEQLCDGYMIKARELASGNTFRLHEQLEHTRKKLRRTDDASVRAPLAEIHVAPTACLSKIIESPQHPVIDTTACPNKFLSKARIATELCCK
jgi:hypothetical protein